MDESQIRLLLVDDEAIILTLFKAPCKREVTP